MCLEQQEQGGEDVGVIDTCVIRRGAVQTRLKWHELESPRNIRATIMLFVLAGLVRVLFLLGIGFLFHDRALDVGRDQVMRPNKD